MTARIPGTVRVTINIDVASFGDARASRARLEVAAMLRRAAQQVETGSFAGACVDSRGELVGGWDAAALAITEPSTAKTWADYRNAMQVRESAFSGLELPTGIDMAYVEELKKQHNKDALRNGNGLTYNEWLCAAGIGIAEDPFPADPIAGAGNPARTAWLNNEDPTCWRAESSNGEELKREG